MSKGDTKTYRNNINSEQARNNGLFYNSYNPALSRVNETANRADAERNDIASRYKSLYDTADESNSDIDTLRGLIGRGGHTADNTGYNEFAKTGGYSDKDIANVRSRNLAPIRAARESGMNDMNRRLSIQGGYMPGFADGISKLNRESGRAMSDAALSGEIGLRDTINKGRMWGIEGAETNNARAAEINNQARGVDAEIARYLGDRGTNNKLNAINGLLNLYGSSSGELGQANQMLSGLLGLNQGNSQNFLNNWNEISNRPGWGTNLMQGLGAGAGLMSALFPTGVA